MSAASYVPGAWTGLVCAGLSALVGPGAPRSLVAAVWDIAATGGGVHDALAALGEEAELPPFALVTLTRTGLLHAALRGGVEVAVAESSGVRELRAEAGAPWTEVTAHDVPAVTLRAPAGGGTPAPPLPLVSGVVLAAAVRVTAEPWELVPDAEPGASFDELEGLTMVRGDLARLRPGPAAPEAPASAPEPVPVARILLSTGLVVPLDRTVLIGRAPRVGRVSNAELPRLVTVPSPQQDVSRTHAEVRQEGEQVLVTDLGSLNGVRVTRTGATPRRLHPGEATVVVPGDVVDLGDGATFSLEGE